MPEKPPAWTPSSGQTGQVPLATSQDVDSAGVSPASGKDAHALAEQIVRGEQPVINKFVAKQRQQIEIGQLNIHKAVLPLPDMDVYYSYTQGLEQLHYHITPQADEPPAVPELPEIEVEAPSPTPPDAPEIPEPPAPPETPELPETPEPKAPEEEEPEAEPEEPEEPEDEPTFPGQPDFLFVDIPCWLAVEFESGGGGVSSSGGGGSAPPLGGGGGSAPPGGGESTPIA